MLVLLLKLLDNENIVEIGIGNILKLTSVGVFLEKATMVIELSDEKECRDYHVKKGDTLTLNIPEEVTITVYEIYTEDQAVKIGVNAPSHIIIDRKKVRDSRNHRIGRVLNLHKNV